MTVPASGGATTIEPGTPAMLLTEYAQGSTNPLYVINQSADRVWLAGDSSVGPSNGTPVEGFTSVPWTTAGQLWIVADPSAAAPISIVTSTDISSWQPSPAAIGIEVAQQLLASGVPNVLVTETIADHVTIPTAGILSWDVTGFASITIAPEATDPTQPIALQIAQDHFPFETIYFTKPNRVATVALIGSELEIVNDSGVPVVLTINGSNRAARERIDVRAYASNSDGWRGALPAGIGSTDLVQVDYTEQVALQGEVRGHFAVDPDVDGEFRLNYAAVSVEICDTGQMFVSADGAQRATLNLALPAVDYAVSFEVHGGAAAGTAGKVATVRFVPVAY